MNFIKRASLSLIRRPGKSLLLLVLIFILSNVLAASIAIGEASSNVEKTMKAQLGADATLELDYDKISQLPDFNWDQIVPITAPIIEAVGALSQVRYYDYNQEMWLSSSNLIGYDPNNENMEFSYFNLKGVQYAPIMDFDKGRGDLIEGRVFSNQDIADRAYVALISDKVAELNNLFIGDRISVRNVYYNKDNQEVVRDIILDVIGIFQPVLQQQNPSVREGWVDYSAFNRIYVPNGVTQLENRWWLEQYVNDYPDSGVQIDQVYLYPTFVLTDPEVIESFRTEALNYLPDYYRVRVSSDAYDSVAGPIRFIGGLSTTLLWVGILATVLILSLVVILFLRDRKHELGIYLALGERPYKVMAQIVVETMSVAILAISLSLISGQWMARLTSDALLQMRVGESENGGIMPYFEGNYLSPEDVINAYAIDFDLRYVLLLYGVGLGTIAVSSIAPMIYILRLKPKKILM
jgi:putative ABC transport system permease protein